MKIQKARRFNKADYPDAPDWMEPIFQVLNTQFERFVTLFQNNVTFGDNFRAEIITLDVTHDKTFPVRLRALKRNPIGMIVLGSSYFDYPTWVFEPTEDELVVNVKIKWDTPPNDEVRTTLLFIGS